MKTMTSALLAVVLVVGAWTGTSPARAQTTKPLVIAVGHVPDNIDLTQSRNGPIARPTMENVTEALVGLSPNGDLRPTLATWTVSPDGKTIEFRLRPGVKFHTGELLTARDMEFSHNRMLEKKVTSYMRQMRDLDRFEVVDDTTFRYVFKTPTIGFLPSRGPFAVSKAYFDRVGDKEFSERPVGTGPYRLVDHKLGQSVDLEAFDGYWGGKPAIARVRIAFVKEDTTRVSMLKAGEADLIMNTPFAQVDELAKAGFKNESSVVHPSMSIQFPFANRTAPWADVRVRRAIAYAVDGDALVKGLFHSIPKRYARLAPGEVGYDANLKPYPYDPAQARKLLAEAGYANGFSLPLYYWAGTYSGIRETAEAVALYLKAVGIDVKIQGFEPPQMMERMFARRNAEDSDLVMLSPLTLANYTDPAEALGFAFSSQSTMSLYKNADFDREVTAANNTMDADKRAAYVKEAVRIMHDDVASITIWNNVVVYTMKKNIAFTPTQRNLALLYLTNLRVQ
jgi:peptide/nickel transport system substrate-binding protein